MTQNVRLQNLRDFTVQIRNEADQIVGTGIAVSMDGKVVTCRHVVETAIRHKDIEGAEVGVYFPKMEGRDAQKCMAIVEKYFSSHEDDVVLLALTGGASPLAPEQIPVLGTGDSSDGNLFRSYGYRKLDKYVAGWADGKIQGCVEAPEDFNVQCEPIQLESAQINVGMSGSSVLDTTRNLVVGIVSETWFPELSTKDRDTAWAVNGRVLSLEPLGLAVQDAPQPLKAAPEPKFDKAQAEAAIFIKEKFSWNNAPAVLTEWTGRDDLLAQITANWNDPKKHVTGLIGFGGEGKSSLARKWVETLDIGHSTFDGLFWWGFYENRSVDEFLESALNFLSSGKIGQNQEPSSSMRTQIIGAMISSGRYLFVLDGLEVLQYQEGDLYGLLQSADLRELLTYFASPENQSFCLITSRVPVLDLIDYTTYTHCDVERFSENDGIALLDNLGIKGSKEQKRKVVSDWDGHALTLSILAAYLVECYNGNVIHLADIPIPTVHEPRYERVHRILRRYDEHLKDVEREFLKIFSAFRTPIHELAFEKVFVPLLSKVDTTRPLQATSMLIKFFKPKKKINGVDGLLLHDIVNHLVTYRIIKRDVVTKTYTAHPLIRNYYHTYLVQDSESPDVHTKIKDFYLSIAGALLQFPTLDDLKPLIEAVHHACEAGLYDEAYDIRKNRIDQESKCILSYQLGAYDTALNLMYEFFPNKNATKEPQCKNSGANRFILNHTGVCLMNLGRLREAVPFFERYVKGSIESQDWHSVSGGYQNLASLYAYLGTLEASVKSAQYALEFARRVGNKQDEYASLANQAWVLHLRGDLSAASIAFGQAEKIIKKLFSQLQYLFSLWGIKHADHLRREKDFSYARRVTISNMGQCQLGHWIFLLSQCHRVLGDLDFSLHKLKTARIHYDAAIKIAQSISNRQTLIEALLARGNFLAKVSTGIRGFNLLDTLKKKFFSKTLNGLENNLDVEQSFIDLNEALDYAVESGYRIYEVDVRIAFGWAYLANGKRGKASEFAKRALQMSEEMGYHWGKVDAREVLERIESGE